MTEITNVTAAAGTTNGASPASNSIDVPYGASLGNDVNMFEQSIQAAQSTEVSEIAEAAFRPLEHLNTEAESLGDYAAQAVESGNELTPGEIVSLTVKSQKFMFHSQLTANVANRTADGIQQLFRQQG